MVVTDDAGLAAAASSLRNQGRDDDGTWLRHVSLGYNYRIDELSAALGVAQLAVSGSFEQVATRCGGVRAGARRPRLAAHSDRRRWSRVDWFVYVIRLDPGVDRDRMIDQLATRGVPARPYFSPIHLQPLYRERFGFREGDFPVTEAVAR